MQGNKFGYRLAAETAIGAASSVSASKMAETVIADVRKGWKIQLSFILCKGSIGHHVTKDYWLTLIDELHASSFTKKEIDRALKGDRDALIRISNLDRESMHTLALAVKEIAGRNKPKKGKSRKS